MPEMYSECIRTNRNKTIEFVDQTFGTLLYVEDVTCGS